MDGPMEQESTCVLQANDVVIDARGQQAFSWQQLIEKIKEKNGHQAIAWRSLQMLYLPRNRLSTWTGIETCYSLRFLDLSHNMLDRLPARSFWRTLQNLRVLLLGHNRIKSIASLQSLSTIPNLTVISIAGNPVASRATCRHVIANANPSIRLIDNFLVSDEEIMEGATMGRRFGILSPFLQMPAFTSLPYVTSEVHISMLDSLLKNVQEKHAMNSPIILVQRTVRAFLERTRRARLLEGLGIKPTALLKKNSRASVSSTAVPPLQRSPSIVSRRRGAILPRTDSSAGTIRIPTFARKESITNADSIAKQHVRSIGTYEMLQAQSNCIMLVPSHALSAALLKRLLSKAEAITGDSVPAWSQLLETDVFLLSTPDVRLQDQSLFRRSTQNQSFQRSCSKHKLCGPAGKPNFSIIHRRMCTPSCWERDAMYKGWTSWSPGPENRRLLRFRCPSDEFQEILLKLIYDFNEKSGHFRGTNLNSTSVQPQLIVFRYSEVERARCALVLQTCYRRYRLRRLLGYTVGRALLRRRARLAILEFFRMYLLRLRFRFLMCAREACTLNTNVVFVGRGHIDLLSLSPNPFIRQGLFPEHKWKFDMISVASKENRDYEADNYSKEGSTIQSQGWHEDSILVTIGEGSSVRKELRPGVSPAWFGWKHETIPHRADDSEEKVLKDQLGKLLTWGASTSSRAVRYTLSQCSSSSSFDDDEGPSNPTMPSLQWMVRFRSIDEARIRAFLLFVNSWDPITGSYCQLVPAIEVDGDLRPAFRADKLPSSYREVPNLNDATKEIQSKDGWRALMISTSKFNAHGVWNLISNLDRHLSSRPTRAEEGEHVVFDEFILGNGQTDESIKQGATDSVKSRMAQQAKKLEIESFNPARAFEEEIYGKESVSRRKKEIAEIARDESLHLEVLRESLGRQRLHHIREMSTRARHVRSLRLKSAERSKPVKSKSHDHAQTARESKVELIRENTARAQKARSLKEQFQKDSALDKRMNRNELRRRLARERKELEQCKREKYDQKMDCLRDSRIARLKELQRRARNAGSREFAQHFARQQNQITRQIRAGKREWLRGEQNSLAKQMVQKKKLDSAERRQNARDLLLLDFNKRRQNALVQQLESRDAVHRRRRERQNQIASEKAKRVHLREMRALIARGIVSARDPVHSRIAARPMSSPAPSRNHLRAADDEYVDMDAVDDEIYANQLMQTTAQDSYLADRIDELEELADHVKTQIHDNIVQ